MKRFVGLVAFLSFAAVPAVAGDACVTANDI